MGKYRLNIDFIEVNKLVESVKDPSVQVFDTLPDFLVIDYKKLTDYFNITTNNINPRVTISTGGRKDRIFFKKPEPECVSRILINCGPLELIKFYRNKVPVEDVLDCGEVTIIPMDYCDCDIVIASNPIRKFKSIMTQGKNFNNSQCSVVKEFSKPRKFDHRGIFIMIDLIADIDKIAKGRELELAANPVFNIEIPRTEDMYAKDYPEEEIITRL